MIRKIIVFMKRDFQMMISYKIATVFGYMQLILNLFLFVFFAKMFGERMLDVLQPYGGDYISYILVGSIGWGYLWNTMSSAAGSIRQEMLRGTFEPVFLTPTSPLVVVMAYTIWGMVMGTISMCIFLFLGFTVFDVVLTGSVALSMLIMAISVVMMIGFGLTIAGFNIFLKQVGAVVSFIQGVCIFLSGVYFPISVLPEFAQSLSKILPFYYSITGLRLALSPQSSVEAVMSYIFLLSLVSVGALASGAVIFKMGLDKARKEGTLSYY